MPVAPLDKCTVTGPVLSPDGLPLYPAVVRFTMSSRDRDGLITIMPAPVDAPTDADGNISVDLWPNIDGYAGTFYKATVTTTAGKVSTSYPGFTVVVPDTDTANLAEISELVPPPSVDDAQAAAQAAQGYASAAHADAVQTGLDRVQTGADRAATHADKLAADADAAATAADRVQTGADRTATHTDKLAADAGAVATAADRVQTGLDRSAASASAASAFTSASAAAGAAGISGTFITHALATAAVAGIGANAYVQVLADEDHLYHRTLYQKLSGVLTFIFDFETGKTVTPEQFGAVGDGVADDTAALYAMFTLFSSIKLAIVLRPGAVYLSGGSLKLRDGWVVIGHAAQIKRINEVSSATATAISTNTTSITVSNGALFRVGWNITVFNGASYEPQPHRISAINGNVLTVSSAWQVAFPSGGTVITCGYMVDGNGNLDAKVFGLEVDDNKAGNTTLNRWETHVAIKVIGKGTTVEDCYVHDCCSEGIMGGDGGRITRNRVANSNGNGVHLSGTTAMSWVTHCDVRNSNLNIATGHNDGAICFSNTAGAFIAFNYLDGGLCGVGALDFSFDGQTHVFKNVIKNMTAFAIEGVLPNGNTLDSLFIEGNYIKDCVELPVNYTGTIGNGGFTNVRINNNVLINTRMTLRGITSLRMSGNTVDLTGDTTHVCLQHSYLTDAALNDNSFIGGINGLYHGGGNVDVVINNPKFKNNNQRAVNGIGGILNNPQIVLESTYTPTAPWYGIVAANGETVQGGQLRGAAAVTAIGILLPSGGVGVRAGTVIGMILLTTGFQYDIRAPGGSQNNVVRNCGCTGTVSNAGSGAWDTYALVA